MLEDCVVDRLAAALDLLFLVVLAVAVARPIVQVKQWRQMAVLSKLVLLTNSPQPKVVGLDAYGLEIVGTRKVSEMG